MTLNRILSVTALSILVAAAIPAASVSADAGDSRADRASSTAGDDVEKVIARTSDISLAACWTTFNPPAPNGAPLNQTYVNCNPSAIYVASGYIYQGQVNLGGEINCKYVPVGGTISWYWSSTQPGAQYTTVICAYPA
jgi:hypothetical protein